MTSVPLDPPPRADLPFQPSHALLGTPLRWPDGKVGNVGGITTSTAEGVVNPHAYPHLEQLIAQGKRRATVVVFRDDGCCSMTLRTLADVEAAQRIHAKTPPRTKANQP